MFLVQGFPRFSKLEASRAVTNLALIAVHITVTNTCPNRDPYNVARRCPATAIGVHGIPLLVGWYSSHGDSVRLMLIIPARLMIIESFGDAGESFAVMLVQVPIYPGCHTTDRLHVAWLSSPFIILTGNPIHRLRFVISLRRVGAVPSRSWSRLCRTYFLALSGVY